MSTLTIQETEKYHLLSCKDEGLPILKTITRRLKFKEQRFLMSGKS